MGVVVGIEVNNDQFEESGQRINHRTQAVISFLRTEGRAYPQVMARAGEYAAHAAVRIAELMADDPMVKAGEFRVETHSWLVPAELIDAADIVAFATRWMERPVLAPLLLLAWCAVSYGISRALFIAARKIFAQRRENFALIL